jgi:hypothetical protein
MFKTLLQYLFGYSTYVVYGRVEQLKFFWTRREAEEWMELYPLGSAAMVCRWKTPIAFRRVVVGWN